MNQFRRNNETKAATQRQSQYFKCISTINSISIVEAFNALHGNLYSIVISTISCGCLCTINQTKKLQNSVKMLACFLFFCLTGRAKYVSFTQLVNRILLSAYNSIRFILSNTIDFTFEISEQKKRKQSTFLLRNVPPDANMRLIFNDVNCNKVLNVWLTMEPCSLLMHATNLTPRSRDTKI